MNDWTGKLLLALCVFAITLTGCDLSGPEHLENVTNQVPMDDLVTDSPIVEVNPSGRAPLSARIAFTTEAPARVTLEIEGPRGIVHQFDETETEHEIPVLGLYPDTTNRVILHLTAPSVGFAVDTLQISTEPLPDIFPTINIVKADEARMEDGMTFSEFSAAGGGIWYTNPFIFDAGGTIRWFLDLSEYGSLLYPVTRLANGNIFAGEKSTIYEFDMLGRVVRTWEIPGYTQHHEITELPGGNLLLAVNKEGLSTVEDHIIELDRTTGNIVNEWDVRQVLDVHRRTFSSNARDWFHMNAIYYDAQDHSLILSGRTQGVAKVTWDNELVWILAPHKGWGKAGPDGTGHETSDFLLTATNSSGSPFSEPVQLGDVDAPDFSWPWGQHAPLVLPNGNLFVFDNGANRNFSGEGSFSRGVEYSINEEEMTVEQIWQYGKERGDQYFSRIISDVDLLPETDNRLIMPGTVNLPVHRALVTEVTYPGKQLIFEASIEFKDLNGSGGSGEGEMDIIYRSERMSLYSE